MVSSLSGKVSHSVTCCHHLTAQGLVSSLVLWSKYQHFHSSFALSQLRQAGLSERFHHILGWRNRRDMNVLSTGSRSCPAWKMQGRDPVVAGLSGAVGLSCRHWLPGSMGTAWPGLLPPRSPGSRVSEFTTQVLSWTAGHSEFRPQESLESVLGCPLRLLCERQVPFLSDLCQERPR